EVYMVEARSRFLQSTHEVGVPVSMQDRPPGGDRVDDPPPAGADCKKLIACPPANQRRVFVQKRRIGMPDVISISVALLWDNVGGRLALKTAADPVQGGKLC